MSRFPLIVVLLSGLCIFLGHSIAQAREKFPLAPTSAVAPTRNPTLLTALSKSLLASINRDRAKHHVAALKLDSRQSGCSQRHSRHMESQETISHDQFPGDICIPHMFVGENVGMEYGNPALGLLDVHKSMMAEGPCPPRNCTEAMAEAHGCYINLMNKTYKRLGIGIYIGSGAVWLTEDFTS